MSFGPGYGEVPADDGKGGLNARTGMTTNTIDYLKQAYSREPCPFGVNTTDVMMRSETPWLSERMAEEVRDTFGAAALRERVHKAPRRERVKPRERKLVGGLHVDKEAYDAAHGTVTARSARTARGSARDHAPNSSRVASARASAAAAGTGTSPNSARASARASARRSARALGNARAVSTGRKWERGPGPQTARLAARKVELEEQLITISRKLKKAICKSKLDPTFEPAQVSADAQLAEYDQDAGYRCHMRNRNTSVVMKDFGMDHFNRKLEAKEHWRQGTEMGKYADKLARNKASLRDVF